eukprot:TRINITY_DN1811_c0_g1_i11.p1 TRINITY_DN1811_c0_g1~~TRINITY_DN1811_c0_g1_i11.p1  ORF type:complete len:126 (-),score=20.84 TRINITY_DN1811_c0_g1_i11:23-400(-)
MRYDEKSLDLERTKRLLELMVPKEHLENATRDIIQLRADLKEKVDELDKVSLQLQSLQEIEVQLRQKISEYEVVEFCCRGFMHIIMNHTMIMIFDEMYLSFWLTWVLSKTISIKYDKQQGVHANV